MTYLAHLTLTTGHLIGSDRAEVGDEAIADCRRMVDAALAGKDAPIGTAFPGYAIRAKRYGSSLFVTVVAAGAEIAVFGVAGRAEHARRLWADLYVRHREYVPAAEPTRPPSAPWCAAAILPAIGAHADALGWLGDFERCVAWAWLERAR